MHASSGADPWLQQEIETQLNISSNKSHIFCILWKFQNSLVMIKSVTLDNDDHHNQPSKYNLITLGQLPLNAIQQPTKCNKNKKKTRNWHTYYFFFLISKKQILYIVQKIKCTQVVNKREPKQQKNTPNTLPTPHPSEEV